MKVAAVSELKAKLARYLRLVKSGEEIEIQERGIPVAILSSVQKPSNVTIIPPRREAARLSKFQFSVNPQKSFDILGLLIEDRRKR